MDAYNPGLTYSYVGSLLGLVILLIVLYIYHRIKVRYCLEPPQMQPRVSYAPSFFNAQRTTRPPANTPAVESLPAYKYNEEVGRVIGEERECAVCLSDFNEGEDVRVLPECLHTFHLPCIDMWLYSHSNCPLCRTATAVGISKGLDGRPPETGGDAP
ncbi:RING-H2 finger protein ATL39-like [Aristolochia californica]|uniref:RING-H2 finger protein ATL39-like n=1 Tax=Aristolochia californica TaxID=171875 RepID=UPI0035D86CDC